jgi:tetratricopeptide (TPR) repeat protein
MSATESQAWLQEAIAAVKSGESEKARGLLLRVIETDESSEQAWLWLSGVVETDGDRRICLENVLTINPDNAVAKMGLAKLAGSPDDVSGSQLSHKRYTVRREKAPVSLAAAVLYPERQVQEWSWEEPEFASQRKGHDTPIAAQSKFEDVWSSEADMCAYCAQALAAEDEKCPNCQRNLIHEAFRYPKPSPNLYVYGALLAAQAQLFLVQGIYSIIQNQALVLEHIILPAIFTAVFFGLAIGIFARKPWAFLASIIGLFIILVIVVASILTPIDFTFLQLPVQDPAITTFIASFGNMINSMIKIFQLGLTVLAFFYGLLLVAPDFTRDQQRVTAVLTKRLKLPADYHARAKELSKKGMWASAVLHWQHAAGKEPHNILYQRHLGLAYAQLSFYERSLDILQSALGLATQPQMQKDLQNIIQTVKKMQSSPKVKHG